MQIKSKKELSQHLRLISVYGEFEYSSRRIYAKWKSLEVHKIHLCQDAVRSFFGQLTSLGVKSRGSTRLSLCCWWIICYQFFHFICCPCLPFFIFRKIPDPSDIPIPVLPVYHLVNLIQRGLWLLHDGIDIGLNNLKFSIFFIIGYKCPQLK